MEAGLATTDLSDANQAVVGNGDLRVLDPVFNIYGKKRCFHGQIVTVKVFEDNVLAQQLLDSAPPHGPGSVLVIDGGGLKRCAMMGGNLASRGSANGWGGVLVNGCIRDVDQINACDIGVRALKPGKKGSGQIRVPVYVAGALLRDGDWLYADADGVLVSKFPLSPVTLTPREEPSFNVFIPSPVH